MRCGGFKKNQVAEGDGHQTHGTARMTPQDGGLPKGGTRIPRGDKELPRSRYAEPADPYKRP